MPLAICVYCGSSPGKDPRYMAAAEKLGRMIGTGGHSLVYGGGNLGLMGAVARGTKAAGGHMTGVIPRFLVTKEKILTDADDIILVNDMHERKKLLFEKADAFVTLPGGIGTLEEIAEQMTWGQLGRHKKPILIADIVGFWRPLLDLIAHMRMEGFIRDGFDVRTMTAEKIDDVIPMLEDWIRRFGKGEAAADWSANLM
jgi:uncharacterized protein (TIGR00730 family)